MIGQVGVLATGMLKPTRIVVSCDPEVPEIAFGTRRICVQKGGMSRLLSLMLQQLSYFGLDLPLSLIHI